MTKILTFNGIKNKIHLKSCVVDITRKDIDYHKQYEYDKLTFYKDYKSNMLWLNSYGIGLENLHFTEIRDNKFLIETNKTKIEVNLK